MSRAAWKAAFAAGFLSALGPQSARAQDKFQYAGCPDVSIADFRKVSLVDKTNHADLNEPLKMALARDGRLFFVERMGKVKVWDPTTKAVQELGRLNAFSNHEQGVIGIALDPGFAANSFLYINYAFAGADVFRVSRFTLAAGRLEMATEKVILDIPTQRRTCCHTGGDLVFDARGDLWISVGNNINNGSYVDEAFPDLDDQGHSANTNDLRGKILRIHPLAEPVNGRYYSIPKGNLFPEGTAQTKPEIYTMGHRNPYTLSVDSQTGWVTYGDIGPDEGWDTEEHGLATAASNMGWPYFAGSAGNEHYKYRLDKDPARPENNSPNNTGLKVLPPAVPALIGYRQSAAITGPIYRYDAALASAVKLPPHFHGKWFITDFNKDWVKAVGVSTDGRTVTDSRILVKERDLIRPIHMQMGPEGALYVLEYAGWANSNADTRIARFEYTGTCLPKTTGIAGGASGKPGARAPRLQAFLGFGPVGNGAARPLGSAPEASSAPDASSAFFDLKGKRLPLNGGGIGTGNTEVSAGIRISR